MCWFVPRLRLCIPRFLFARSTISFVCSYVPRFIVCLVVLSKSSFVRPFVRSCVRSMISFVLSFLGVHQFIALLFGWGLFLVSCVSCIASWRGCVFGLTFFVFRCFSCDAVTAACVNCSRDASRPSVLLVEQPKNACAMTSPSRSVGRCSALRAA